MIDESGNKTSTLAAGVGKKRHPERVLDNPRPLAGAYMDQEEWEQERAKALWLGGPGTPHGLFCGFVRNKWTFFWPSPGISIACR